MLFNSIDFLIFLPIVFVLYWIINHYSIRLRNLFLIVASYVFYGWWDWRFLSLIIFSSVVDYIVGLRLNSATKTSHRKLLLIISLSINLGFLGFFKYYNFFVDSFITAFSFMGNEFSATPLNILLPVGISFYTFQTLSYSIDIYYQKIKPTKDLIAFFAFVSFFPQLVAGPIERASHLLPQFHTKKILSYENISTGVKLVIWGFFMKLVVADRAAIYVNAVYNNVPNHDGLSFILATVLFAFQIYGDFAGYSLIAIGTARFFDFSLMTNFRRPYFAVSIGEFWKRWHISLSTWFRDYLYIPLGGNRVSTPKWLANLFITFVISGLWHGANWTFIIWGALNGIYLIIEALLPVKDKHKPVRILITFVLINFSWIFFRANSVSEAFYIVKDIFIEPGKLFLGDGDDITAPLYAILAISILLFVEFSMEYFNSISRFNKLKPSIKMMGFSFIIFLILYLGVFDSSQFIYFQF
ncbi:MAG TPA: membrane-bound O-acyltransferase family protein [Balneolaceae bacterium]|nr:membrane-bound O-acyltransferase family protein [Balneolaceae bacterium]|tara:strand:+ start:61999 stop:63405 length:1407 start_codon:yes stop_codon:yes gene_type:complete